jgi:tetratricopeptide (TPR) repeat protein
MDEQRFDHAIQTKQSGKPRDAYEEFVTIASMCQDPIDKAGALLYAEFCLKDAGDFEAAQLQLEAVADLVRSSDNSADATDEDDRIMWLRIALRLEEADFSRLQGRPAEALTKFQNLLAQFSVPLHQPQYNSDYKMILVRLGFTLADLGKWSDALPLLQEEEVAESGAASALFNFYLGTCYVGVGDLSKGVLRLRESLQGFLPTSLEYRAHSSLGKAYFNLGEYRLAKTELEKASETSNPAYIREAHLWKWLEAASRHLGLNDEANRYSQLAAAESRS